MIKKLFNLLFISVILTSCTKNASDASSPAGDYSSSEKGGAGSGSGNQNPNQPGLITAAEWNDLDNWSFWAKLISSDDFKSMPNYWMMDNSNRIAVEVKTPANKPVINALVRLKKSGNVVFTARTDNHGKAELWVDLFQTNANVDYSKFTIDVNNSINTVKEVKPFKDGKHSITLAESQVNNNIEIAFVVDATGSMGDELEYLKTELLDVISKIKVKNTNSKILTSSVFYRDEGDNYVTRVSNFSENINTTLDFIKAQSAAGGGDFPEAVHSALDKSINELQWSTNAKTRILFLLLDAPPHHTNAIISDIQKSVMTASEKGIKIIPITASGIDKETEFLMRFLALSTNGTYVFITDDSGIGNSHLEPSVGEYQVELLNDLMVRLINKYAE